MQRDRRFLALIQEVPEFLHVLSESQKSVLHNATKNSILLRYFFACISEDQLKQFEALISESVKDAEHEQALRELAQQIPV